MADPDTLGPAEVVELAELLIYTWQGSDVPTLEEAVSLVETSSSFTRSFSPSDYLRLLRILTADSPLLKSTDVVAAVEDLTAELQRAVQKRLLRIQIRFAMITSLLLATTCIFASLFFLR